MTLKIMNNVGRSTIIVDASEATPRAMCDEHGIDYNRYDVLIGAQHLHADELDMTFEQLGFLNDDDVSLNGTVKATSAV